MDEFKYCVWCGDLFAKLDEYDNHHFKKKMTCGKHECRYAHSSSVKRSKFIEKHGETKACRMCSSAISIYDFKSTSAFKERGFCNQCVDRARKTGCGRKTKFPDGKTCVSCGVKYTYKERGACFAQSTTCGLTSCVRKTITGRPSTKPHSGTLRKCAGCDVIIRLDWRNAQYHSHECYLRQKRKPKCTNPPS